MNSETIPTTLRDLIAEEHHAGRYIQIDRLLQAAHGRDITVTWDELREIAGRDTIIVPGFITDFVAAYAEAREPKTIFDPWAGVGSLLTPVVRACNPSLAIGITRIPPEAAAARVMGGSADIDWVLSQPHEALTTVGDFDLIVSCPPLGLRAQTITVTHRKHTLTVRDSGTYTLLLESLQHLLPNGIGVFLLPNGLVLQRPRDGVREALDKLGLYLNAVIAVPAGALAPYTTVPLNLVFFSRTQTKDLFVGQLTPSTNHEPLLTNLLKRKVGASVDFGRLVDPVDFTSWQQLAAVDEQQQLAKRSGLTPAPLSDIVSAIKMGKQTEDGGFENLPNCVYLPLIGTSPAVAALSDLRIKPHNYVQLVVRPEVATAEFLAGFFNSPLGRKTRDAMLSGTFIPKLSKQTITRGTVYLLPPEAQQTATSVGREIQDLRLRLEQLERDLWSRPGDAPKIGKVVSRLNHKEAFESWLETLPFPLASILWRYQAAGNPEHKVMHLLNAFEALAQFLGTLMTSAFYSNHSFFNEHRNDWFERGKGNPHSLARSSFGDWVVRCRRLAKTTRQLLSDKDQRALAIGLYRTDAENIETLSAKGLYDVLEKGARYRNDWKGHTGIIGAKEQEHRLGILQEELTRLHGLLGGVFETWWLVRPGQNTYTGAVYHYTVDKLAGTRQIFKQEAITTTEVMDAAELYCYDVAARRPLQLLHFVRMLPSPDTEEIACYFYNRIEKNGVRWVSYHFEKAADRIEPDASVLKVINEVEEEAGS